LPWDRLQKSAKQHDLYFQPDVPLRVVKIID
jgi:hypothetical protein